MRAILKQLQKVQVLVVGDPVVDHYVFGVTTRISREAPVPVVLHESEEVRPGGAANAAVNVPALGARCRFVGVVGRDDAAAQFKTSMQRTGVTLSLVVEAGRATAQKTRVLAGAQGTGRQQVLRLDRDPKGPPSAASVKKLVLALHRAAKDGTQGVLISDYGQGLLEPAVLEAVKALAATGMPVLVDSRYALGRIHGPVVLKPNQPELSELVGRPVNTVEEAVKACQQVLKRQGALAVVNTRGRDGMVVVARSGRPTVVPAHLFTDVTDVTGAGDTVAASLITALAAGVPLVDAARLANAAASVVVGKLGAATASPAEILAILEEAEKRQP